MEEPDFSSVDTMDLTAGALSVDFVNTGSRLAERAPGSGEGGPYGDRLNDYADLVRFGERSGVVGRDLGEALRGRAAAEPAAAGAVLEAARLVREALYRVFLAAASGSAPAEGDLALVQGAAAAAGAQQRLMWSGGALELTWPEEPALERVLWPVVRSAVSLLTSADLERVKQCAAHDCNWLFLDASRNRSRRWCDMKACGNRAKARQYYHRHQGE